MLNEMDNEKSSATSHTPIQYLLQKQEAHTTTADLPVRLRLGPTQDVPYALIIWYIFKISYLL